MKIKQLLICFLILGFLGAIAFSAYRYALWKARKDIIKEINKNLKSKADYKDFSLSLSNIEIKEFKTKGILLNNLRLNYNLLDVITFKNFGFLYVDKLEINIDSLIRNLKLKKEKKKKIVSPLKSFLVLNRGKVNRLILHYKNKIFVFKNIIFSLNLKGDELHAQINFGSSFYNLRGSLNIYKRKNTLKIFTKNFKSDLFDLNFNAELKRKDFEFIIFNSKFKEYSFKNIDAKGKIEGNVINFEKFNIESNIVKLNSSFIYKNLTLSGKSKGFLNYKEFKGKFLTDFNIDLKKEKFYGKIILSNFNYKDINFERIYFSGKMDKKKIYPDSLYVTSDLIKLNGKRRDSVFVFNIKKLDSDLIKKFFVLEKDLHFVMRSKGQIQLKENDFDILMQGVLEKFVFKDLKIDFINFTFRRENYLNELNLSVPEFYFRNLKSNIDLLTIRFRKKDSINFKIKALLPFTGDFEEEGYFINKKDKKVLIAKSGRIDIYPKIKINIDSLRFMRGRLRIKEKGGEYEISLEKGDLSFLPYINILGEVNINGKFSMDFPKIRNVNLSINIKDFLYKYFSLNEINMNLSGDEKGYELTGEFEKEKGKGRINISLSSPENIYFEIYGNDFDVGEFNIPLKDLFSFKKGDYDFNIEGYYKNKKLTYEAEFNFERVGGIFYPIGVSFHDVHVILNSKNDTFTYDFTGLSEGGKIRGSGWGAVEWGKDIVTGGKIRVFNTDLYVTPEIEANVNGEIEYKKDAAGLEVNGNLFINKCFITPKFENKGTVFSKTKINLDFEGDNIFIISDYFNAELSGNLSIKSPDYVRRLYNGKFRVKRGNVFYLGKIFDISENSYLLLKGVSSFEPDLNLEAETYVYSPQNKEKVRIIISVKGSLSSPRFILKSEPPVYSSSEIIKMLAMGGELPGAEIIEGTISQEIRKRLKLKELMITGLLHGDPTFTVGTYVSENIYIKYLQGIVDKSKNLYLIRYFILPGISIYAEKDEKGSAQGGVEIEIRF